MTARLYSSYSNQSRSVKANELVDRRAIVYYSNTDAQATAGLSSAISQLATPDGWNGVIVADPDSVRYLLLSNFASDQKCVLSGVAVSAAYGAPVFSSLTTISDSKASAEFIAEENHSVANAIRFFVRGNDIQAIQDPDNDAVIYVKALSSGQSATVSAAIEGHRISKVLTLGQKTWKISISGGELQVEEAKGFPENTEEDLTQGYIDITTQKLVNASFEDDQTYGNANGNVTLGSTTYNPCYTNSVAAVNSKWPNILPVQGWTAGNQLSSGSNFCRMYSMPYSATMYCVSPSTVGN